MTHTFSPTADIRLEISGQLLLLFSYYSLLKKVRDRVVFHTGLFSYLTSPHH